MEFDTENVDEVVEDVESTGSDDVVNNNHNVDDTDEYVPSYTYKVKDEERQFDERFNDFIKDKETEDYIRDLYTKADGLDSYKEKVANYEGNIQDYETKLSQMQEGFGTLKKYRESGDYRKLFGALGINENEMLEYAYSVAQEQELPQEERDAIANRREQEDRLAMLERQLAEQQAYRQESIVQNDLRELEGYIATNADLNERMKIAGFNLRDEVLSYGMTQTKITGVEPSIGEVVATVVNRFNNLLGNTNTQQQRPDALPNIKGTNQTAPQKRYSLDDLRAMSNKIR